MIRRNKWVPGAVLTVFLAASAASTWADSEAFIHGGGIISTGHGQDASKITLSVDIYVPDDGQAIGFFDIHFHNVNDLYDLDKSQFTATEFGAVTVTSNTVDGQDYLFVRIEASGTLDGEEGWSVIARIADFGSPGQAKKQPGGLTDAIRLSLFDPFGEGVFYDTATLDPPDFPREQAWRTFLDGGNITAVVNISPGIP